MPDEGWPTLADVHAAVLRVDGRLELLAHRQDAQAQQLERHRARLDGLGRWRWLLTGGLVVMAAVVVPLLLELVRGLAS